MPSIEHEIKAKVNKARREGFWFYNAQSMHWMTPDELEAEALANIIVGSLTHSPMLINYHMSDPREGIRVGMAHIKKASIEVQEFTDKVRSYFNIQSKDRRMKKIIFVFIC